MLEFFLCSLVTILPDYLVRRYAQGKRIGTDINLFTVWYELRWGITACAILTISLITMIFYYHPSTKNAGSMFRTLTILSESGGRVEEVFVANGQDVEEGEKLFSLESSVQKTAVVTAQSKIAEVDAAIVLAQSELAAASGQLDQARASYEQTFDDLTRTRTLSERGSSAVSQRDLERLENLINVRQGAIDSAMANVQAVETRISILLPAQKETAIAALEQAEAQFDKTIVYAGTSGVVEQFTLRPGDYVNPILRPAGILIPENIGGASIIAGFGQITAQVVKPGSLAEVTCVSDPFRVHPMVVVEVQDVIPAGQIRPTDALLDLQDRARPGTLTAYLAPLYKGTMDHIPRGSKCIANAYTNNHDRLDDPDLTTGQRVFLHAVDTVGMVHALILRMQAVLLPVQTLVFSGH